MNIDIKTETYTHRECQPVEIKNMLDDYIKEQVESYGTEVFKIKFEDDMSLDLIELLDNDDIFHYHEILDYDETYVSFEQWVDTNWKYIIKDLPEYIFYQCFELYEHLEGEGKELKKTWFPKYVKDGDSYKLNTQQSVKKKLINTSV